MRKAHMQQMKDQDEKDFWDYQREKLQCRVTVTCQTSGESAYISCIVIRVAEALCSLMTCSLNLLWISSPQWHFQVECP